MYCLLEDVDRSYGVSVTDESADGVLAPVVPACRPVACSTRWADLRRSGFGQVLSFESGCLVHVALLATPRPLREHLALVAPDRSTPLGPLLDPPHVPVHEATAVVDNDMVGCLASDLVVQIPEPALGPGLHPLLRSHQLAVTPGAVLRPGDLALESTDRLVPKPLDGPAFPAVDHRYVDRAFVRPGGKCHRVDDSLIDGSHRITAGLRSLGDVGDVQRPPPGVDVPTELDLSPHLRWHLYTSCRVDDRGKGEREPRPSSAEGEIEPAVDDSPAVPLRERQRTIVLLAPWATSLHTVLAIGPISRDRFVEVVGNDLSGVGMEWAVLSGDGGEEGLNVVLSR